MDYDALTSAGGVVRIRTLGPQDADSLRLLHERVSDESFYRRFFHGNRRVGLDYVDRLVAKSRGKGEVALVAVKDETLVAVAALERTCPDKAEVSLLVDDSCHGQGIGTLLLEELLELARRDGLQHLDADILGSNSPMLRVLTDSALVTRSSVESGVITVDLDTHLAAAAIEAVDERDRRSDEQSLLPIFTPKAVAVIGAGRTKGGIGHEILRNIVDGGFRGLVFAVNPGADFVCGVASYPSVSDIPEHVDLAIVAVPAEKVPTTIAECAEAGVAGAVVVSSGFGEASEHGAALQREMLHEARRVGMRIVGPNCLGIAITNPHVMLNATFATCMPLPGGLALASQSGAVGIAALEMATSGRLGLSEFVSLGNKADVSGNDLLLHWWRDPRTRAIALYLESFGNPRKFARLARRIGQEKPVLIVKGGRSPGGLRAGASHTAAAASSETAVDALFAQSGIVRLDTIGELLDVAQVMVSQPLPASDRLGIIGNAGGAGVLAADAAAAAGLEVSQLSRETQSAMRELAPGAAGVANPIDLGAGCSAEVLGKAVLALARSGEVDVLAVIVAATRSNSVLEAAAAVRHTLRGQNLPHALILLGASTAELQDGDDLPRFSLPEPAIRALGRLSAYARWRRRDPGKVPALHDADLEAARLAARSWVRSKNNLGWLDSDRAAQLLSHVGVTVSEGRVVRGVRSARRAASEIGYPVVVKAADSALIHKSDIGAVRTGIDGPAALGKAVHAVAFAAESAGYDPALLVQPSIEGVEFAIGMIHEPLFGPVLMLSAGGVLIDILDDRTWRIPPLTTVDADEMVDSLRSARLLDGYRGSPRVDRPALLDLLHRVGQLVDAVPEIAELDLNPVVVRTSGAVVVDAKIRVAEPAPEPDPYSRGLR